MATHLPLTPDKTKTPEGQMEETGKIKEGVKDSEAEKDQLKEANSEEMKRLSTECTKIHQRFMLDTHTIWKDLHPSWYEEHCRLIASLDRSSFTDIQTVRRHQQRMDTVSRFPDHRRSKFIYRSHKEIENMQVANAILKEQKEGQQKQKQKFQKAGTNKRKR